jgi:SNF2 family DNA or RNA helicase
MIILHGTWIPENNSGIIQLGKFYFWAEIDTQQKHSDPEINPWTLGKEKLQDLFDNKLQIKYLYSKKQAVELINTKYFNLPTTAKCPLPSLELSQYIEPSSEDDVFFDYWKICCYHPPENINIFNIIKETRYLSLHKKYGIKIDKDILFWFYYLQKIKQAIVQDNYIPALKLIEKNRTEQASTGQNSELYPIWKMISEDFRNNLATDAKKMPLICVSGFNQKYDEPKHYQKQSFLKHFTENIINEIIQQSALPVTEAQKLSGSFLINHVGNNLEETIPKISLDNIDLYKKWIAWYKQLIHPHDEEDKFNLYFELEKLEPVNQNKLNLVFWVSSTDNPEQKILLKHYWLYSQQKKRILLKQFGTDFEHNIILKLTKAAQIYPIIWKVLDNDQPTNIILENDKIYQFLKIHSHVLKEAGFKIITPKWWTNGNKHKVCCVVNANLQIPQYKSKKTYQSELYVNCDYQLSIAGDIVDENQWRDVMKSPIPLVNFNGKWVEINNIQMAQILTLDFFKETKKEKITFTELIQLMGESPRNNLEFTFNDELQSGINKLLQQQIKNPKADLEINELLTGTVPQYIKDGSAWIDFLERYGLNSCIAYELGLQRQLQTIAFLAFELKNNIIEFKNLLVVHTKALGNWKMLIETNLPTIKTYFHHGPLRVKEEKQFFNAIDTYNLILTSYDVLKKDEKIFTQGKWQHIISDRIEELENHHTSPNRTVQRCRGKRRIAITNSNIFNNINDIWSIVNFLTPEYLKKEPFFKKQYEIPIRKENNQEIYNELKKLIQPFILCKNMKNPEIKKELPKTHKQKVYCYLTKEQQIMYNEQIENVKNILATKKSGKENVKHDCIAKLKQICTHTALSQHQNKTFSPDNSYKLQLLFDMVDEAINANNNVVILSQYSTLCENIFAYLKKSLYIKTYLIKENALAEDIKDTIEEYHDNADQQSAFVISSMVDMKAYKLNNITHIFQFDKILNLAIDTKTINNLIPKVNAESIFIHSFVSIGTLEEKIDDYLSIQKVQFSESKGEKWLTELTKNDFIKLIEFDKQATID